MKNTLLLIVLVGAGSGAGAALLTTSLASSTRDDRREVETVARPISVPLSQARPDDGRSEEIAELRRANAELALRLSTLETRPAAIEAARVPVEEAGDAERQAVDEEVRGFMAAFTSAGRVSDLFVARVSEAMDEIQVAQDAEREAERAARQAERIETRLVGLKDELGLSAYQVDEMRVVLTKDEETRSTMWTTIREDGGGRIDLRSRMRELREESNTALQEILDPDQFQRYRESRDGGGGGFSGGGGNARRENRGREGGTRASDRGY